MKTWNWLRTHSHAAHACTTHDFQVRLATYPNESPAGWLAKAQPRHADIGASVDLIVSDLQRWLPASWPMNHATGQDMAHTAMQALAQGMAVMQQLQTSAPKP